MGKTAQGQYQVEYPIEYMNSIYSALILFTSTAVNLYLWRLLSNQRVSHFLRILAVLSFISQAVGVARTYTAFDHIVGFFADWFFMFTVMLSVPIQLESLVIFSVTEEIFKRNRIRTFQKSYVVLSVLLTGSIWFRPLYWSPKTPESAWFVYVSHLN